MKAALVLLSDYNIQNMVRRIVADLSVRERLPLYASTLPTHVSLKQPFTFEDFDRLDAYCEGLAGSLPPFEIRLDRFYLFEGDGYGVLGLNVIETPQLRGLHSRLNAELAGIFQDTRAAFDGEEYRFHLTVEIARDAHSLEVLQRWYAGLAEKTVDLRFTARSLAVFFYPDQTFAPGSFMVYRVITLADGSATIQQ
jgi:2'-5' RNA ligase